MCSLYKSGGEKKTRHAPTCRALSKNASVRCVQKEIPRREHGKPAKSASPPRGETSVLYELVRRSLWRVELRVKRLPLADLGVGVHRGHELSQVREGGGDVVARDAVDDPGGEPPDQAPDGNVGNGHRAPDRVAATAVLGADLLQATEVERQPPVCGDQRGARRRLLVVLHAKGLAYGASDIRAPTDALVHLGRIPPC